jgi:dienelactone hydrolase
VLVLHGFKGFARWGFFPYLADSLARGGLRAITFDFSGSGIGSDRESFTELEAFRDNTINRELEDAAAVRDLARARGWIGNRYGVFGHSRGGGIAILHADRDPDVAALATWAAVSTIARWPPDEMARWRGEGTLSVTNARTGQTLPLGPGLRDEVERDAGGRLSITGAASRLTIPWLLAHGSADETVPFAEAEGLRDAAAHADVQFARLGGASHTMDGSHPLPTPVPARLERAVALTTGFFRARLS